MAINSGAAIIESGTQTTVISDTSAIADGGTNAGTNTALTPSDKVPFAQASLDIQFGTAPSAGGHVQLFRRDLNIDSTNDATAPSGTYEHIYVGSFPLALVTSRQYISLPAVPLSGDQEFRIINEGGQSTTGTTVVKITPQSYNIKA